ncbi:MAG: selenium cofactor biosynthesis protein YqeC [Anaerolineae bacterium]
MRLKEALRVQKGEVISLVGGGGKSTAMYRLASELAGQGWKVVTTTTTLIRTSQGRQSEALIISPDKADALPKISAALGQYNQVTVVSGERVAGKRKLIGLPPDWIADIRDLPQVDAVIVEADGSRLRSLKAPADHEPVVPECTTIHIPVAGLDAVGQSLSNQSAHRPELVARLAGMEMGEPVTPESVASVLGHRQGGLKGASPGARLLPLVNKVEDEEGLMVAREIANQLLREEAIELVLSGAVQSEDPILEAQGRVAAVVLAAGESQRMEKPKQLLSVNGKTFLEHVIETGLASLANQVVVVLGYQAETIGPVAEGYPVRTVVNQDWAGGLSTSVKAGLRAVHPRTAGAVFLLADQPLITPQTINRLILAHRRTLAPVVAPTFRGQRGNPTLFDRRLFPALQALEGDSGGRALIGQYEDSVEWVAVNSDEILFDVDTEENYGSLLEKGSRL